MLEPSTLAVAGLITLNLLTLVALWTAVGTINRQRKALDDLIETCDTQSETIKEYRILTDNLEADLLEARDLLDACSAYFTKNSETGEAV